MFMVVPVILLVVMAADDEEVSHKLFIFESLDEFLLLDNN